MARRAALATLLLFCASAALAADRAESSEAARAAFDPAIARQVIPALAGALESKFLFPEIGRRYAAALRTKLAGGGYDRFDDADSFAEAVTADLQAIHPDGHLRLFAPQVAGKKPKYRIAPSADGAIGKAGWVADGVAYIEFTMFPSDPVTLERLRSFLEAHSSARTLIVDIRRHHGGDIGEVDLLASYLLSEQAELAVLDTREAVDAAGGGPFSDSPTIVRVAGPEGVVRRKHVVSPGETATNLRSAQLFVLTSRRTASAAEHLAMGFKGIGRAILIGESTRGAGHFGNAYALPDGFSAFIPVGRSFDPGTGEGWEGTGVAPDVAVPAEQALDEALRRARVQVDASAALAALD